ncbi:hypothetical protein [Methanopyrus sp. KOL6]|uniref:hypothetical protein n=1 Tax=Methanopyrus sp. KOL6 TaxID=1937004 RepID=UPI000B4C0544|nr:hypothetical protein [Methanopyrus sp. KOL6]
MRLLKAGDRIHGLGWEGKVTAVLDVNGCRVVITSSNPENVPKRVRGGGTVCELAFHDPVGGFAAYWVEPGHSEVTDLGLPEEGTCAVHIGNRWILAEVLEVGRRELSIRIPNVAIPGPGDAGAPVAQNERVVGMLYMYFLEDDCVGRAVRMDVIEKRTERVLKHLRGRQRARSVRP